MYGTRPECPPKALYVEEVLDLNRPTYLVYQEFNLEGYVEGRRKLFPDWTEAQLRNVLYWQNGNLAALRRKVDSAHRLLRTGTALMKPEANGVNLYRTAAASGLRLERIKGLKTCRHMVLLGWSKRPGREERRGLIV